MRLLSPLIPQMAPMNWLVLFLIFTSLSVTVMVKLHFTKNV